MPEAQASADNSNGPQRATASDGDAKIFGILQLLFDLLQKSTIAHHEIADPKQRFWKTYRVVAEAFDNEFLARYGGDMDTSMIFAGLFSAVCATFLSLMKPDLAQDPNVVTQALLQTLVISLNASAASTLLVPVVPVWTGPSATIVWVQCLLYASLACSLFAALAAVLGKQWLSAFQSVGEQGDNTTRGLERQRKFDALQAWRFHAILEVIPILLQLALLLFGAGLCAYIWIQQHTVAIVAIVTNGVCAVFYCSAIGASVVYEDCPFQVPLSAKLRQLFRYLRSSYRTFLPPFTQASKQEHGTPSADRSSHSFEAEVTLSDAVRWLLSTSTDTHVQVDAWPLLTAIPWSSNAIRTLPITVLDRLLYDIRLCFEAKLGPESGQQLALTPRFQDAATSRISAFLFVFWEKLADPDGFFDAQHWVQETDSSSFAGLQHLDVVAAHAPLISLVRLFERTVQCIQHVRAYGKSQLYPMVSANVPEEGSNYEGLCSRVLLYLAQQAALQQEHPGDAVDAEHSLNYHVWAILDDSLIVLQAAPSKVEHVVCAFAALIALTPVAAPFAGGVQSNHKLSTAEMTFSVALRLLLPRLSMPYNVVVSENANELKKLYVDLVPRMCARILAIFSPETRRLSQVFNLDMQAIGMLFRVCLQAPCPRHSETRKACNKHCTEEFPTPRIANWTFTPAISPDEDADCFDSVKNWLPRLYDTTDVEDMCLSPYSVIAFLSRLPSFGRLLILEEHEQTCEFIMGFVRDTMTSGAVEVAGSPRNEILHQNAYAVACVIHALLSAVDANDIPLTLVTRIGTSDVEFHPRLRALLERLVSHTFFSHHDLVGPDDIVVDILLRVGGPSWFDDALYLDWYMPLWIHIARRALVPYIQSREENWRRPSDTLRRNLVLLMACRKLFGFREDANTGDEGLSCGDNIDIGGESTAFWHTDDARCVAVAIGELQLAFWHQSGYREEDPAPDYVLDCVSCSLARIRPENIDMIRCHLEKLQDHVHFLRYTSLELDTFAKVKGLDSDEAMKKAEQYIPQFEELQETIKHMLGHEPQ